MLGATFLYRNKTIIAGTIYVEDVLCFQNYHIYLGPVVQSVLSLTSSLVVKMLTVLVNTISNSYVFLLKKCE